MLNSSNVFFEGHVAGLPYVHGGALATALFRSKANDFIVNEQLSFSPSGEGEHAFITLKKTGLNTDSVAQTLAKFSAVKRRDVAYAGMKDRHAITTQTFSVYLPGIKDPDWSLLEDSTLKVMNVARHRKKLKKGAISANEFTITLRQCPVDREQLRQKVEKVSLMGVPNYFMEQRFGFSGHNLKQAFDIFSQHESFKSKRVKGLLLSAVRSFLFNNVLAQRVAAGTWNTAMEGDAFVLNGTRQFFVEEFIDEEIRQRIIEHDIHPSGPLFGIGSSAVFAAVKNIETSVFKENNVFCEGLIRENVDFSRRSLRVVPENLQLEMRDKETTQLSFKLPSGSYATAVLREIFDTKTDREL
ncbi:MAG: tRNA pseudouridine synthase D [Piscirickettsiaceae bacterium]|nr:MAG: tRNA pseudouridine synthase D [Piscirickettsiaceae bacterium]